MARKLTSKAKVFVTEVADGKNGTQAALIAYDTTSPRVAAAIASENLTKPNIQAALRELGFDESNADRVVANILNDEQIEPNIRIMAADKVYKRMGSYAAEKTFNLTANASVDELKEIIQKDLAKFRPHN